MMDTHLTKLIQRLNAVDSIIDRTGVHPTIIDPNNIWGLQSGGFYVPSSSDSASLSASDSDGEPIIFMFKPRYNTTISMTQSVYNELSHDNDDRVIETKDPMNKYLERCRDVNGVRLEHMSETVSTYLTMHDIFASGAGIMTVFKYNKSVTSPPGILLSAGASSVAVGIPPFFVLDQGVSVDTTKEAIGIADRTICNCLSKVFDSSNPIDFSAKPGKENPDNGIMHPDTFGRMGCIFTFKSYSFDEHGHQTRITNNTVLVIGYRSSDKGYALVYVKSGSNDPVIFTTTSFALSVQNLSNPRSVIQDLHSGEQFNLFDKYDIGVRRFLKLLCDFSYRSYSTVCKVVSHLGVEINVPCYITKDVQSSVGHDQVIYLSNGDGLNGQPIVIPMGFVSSSSTSAPATINTLVKESTARAIQAAESINTTPKLTTIAAKAYGDGFVVCAIYLERINPAESRQPDRKSILISRLRDILQQMSYKLYQLSSTDDIFQSLIVEIDRLDTVASTVRQSSRRLGPQPDVSIIVEEAKQNARDILTRARQSMNDVLPELSDLTNDLSSTLDSHISGIQHISTLEGRSQKEIFDEIIDIIDVLRHKLWLEFDPVYNKWVNGMSELQTFISISGEYTDEDIDIAISKLTSESSTGKRRRYRDSGGSKSRKTKKLHRSRKTRKITKRPKYIKKNVTKHRR